MLSIATGSGNPAAASVPGSSHPDAAGRRGPGARAVAGHRLYAGFVNARARQTDHLVMKAQGEDGPTVKAQASNKCLRKSERLGTLLPYRWSSRDRRKKGKDWNAGFFLGRRRRKLLKRLHPRKEPEANGRKLNAPGKPAEGKGKQTEPNWTKAEAL